MVRRTSRQPGQLIGKKGGCPVVVGKFVPANQQEMRASAPPSRCDHTFAYVTE